MALDASLILGSPQLAGVKVNHKGMAAGAAGGLVGTVAAAVVSGRGDRASDRTPAFGRLAFLAVTDDELALVGLKSGALSVRMGDVIERVPRGHVSSAELGRGLPASLTIAFRDGGIWRLEVPPPNKKQAESVVRVLSG